MKVHVAKKHSESCQGKCDEYVEVFYILGEFHVIYINECIIRQKPFYSILDWNERLVSIFVEDGCKNGELYEVDRRHWDLSLKNETKRNKMLSKSYREVNHIYSNAANTEFCIYTKLPFVQHLLNSQSIQNDADLVKSHLKCYLGRWESEGLINRVNQLVSANRVYVHKEVSVNLLIDEIIKSINKA